ncbi:molybdopterin biosynthesis sulfur carrier protein sulfurylase [Syntrophotalea carbinolica DSM 2380]|uniref:Molybdopterin biosynthesis sulfur carrier protein sulfurylase n=1 Tax=Syntrophotalea carbinolica (strain DSM 2380 / NBRC 103641 / GraBd1) TaxID=338963 RepID=Q3A3U4_SYNC1|nr:HesA/MoeB/ThiF family protein [Syntrophotalea carbinolica]ABA88963.1 molybdopterin biosynthesis sulfur carrier protein sulfurylase [Syntrophotalea carbinolica DSM 2380]
MADLIHFLKASVQGDLVSWASQVAASERYGLSIAEVEKAILELGLLPARYQRNRNMISTRQQLRLFQSHAVVIGCGGLGGYVLEQLARLGVGKITAIDPDTFEEHNLNRQLLSSPRLLGHAKVDVAANRITDINPAVNLIPVRAAFGAENGAELVAGADVVVDAVDNVPARLALANICGKSGIPLVHGAIAGWYGHVATQYPGDTTLQKIYSRFQDSSGVESELGNPSFTPGVAASFQVAEACKVLIDEGDSLRHRKLHLNLLDMEVVEVPF